MREKSKSDVSSTSQSTKEEIEVKPTESPRCSQVTDGDSRSRSTTPWKSWSIVCGFRRRAESGPSAKPPSRAFSPYNPTRISFLSSGASVSVPRPNQASRESTSRPVKSLVVYPSREEYSPARDRYVPVSSSGPDQVIPYCCRSYLPTPMLKPVSFALVGRLLIRWITPPRELRP